MPTLISRRELEVFYVNGIPVVVARARAECTSLMIAGYDEDGLLETEDALKRKAATYRDELRKQETHKRAAFRKRLGKPEIRPD